MKKKSTQIWGDKTNLSRKVKFEANIVFNVQCKTVELGQSKTIQYSRVQFRTVQYITVQCSTVQYSTAQYCQLSKPTTVVNHATEYSG